MSNNVITRDNLPFNFEDGLKVKGIDLSDYNNSNPTLVTTNGNIAVVERA